MGIQTHDDARFTLTHADDTAVVSAFGGQLISWSRGGMPILFENRSHAIVDGKTAYRGGAPICFPYFGKGTLLPLGTTLSPQHGAARTSVWSASLVDGGLVLTTRQPVPEGYGPTHFECQLVYRLEETLSIRAVVRNVGAEEAPFQLAVHAYWAASQPSAAVVHGLGTLYLDNLQGYSEHTDSGSAEPHVPPFDRIYPNAGGALRLFTDRYQVEIACHGGAGAVLWNPGKDHGLKDLGSPDFVCVEVGQIVPSRVLRPDEEHVIEISFRAS